MAPVVPPDLFVGRIRELDTLRAALTSALAARGRVVLLAGEPGIGKTRTAERFVPEARAAGAEVLIGRCYEGEGAPAFWAWSQVLRDYVAARDPATLCAELGTSAAAVAAISPELRDALPGVPAPPDDEHARFRLFEGVRRALLEAARRRPLVLLFDDLHGADTPSLLMLQFLARALRAARILVVGGLRDVALAAGHPLAETLGELVREQVAELVTFQGLDRAEVGELIRRVRGRAESDETVAAVHERTEGNPLYVTEVVRTLAATGRVEIPATVRAAIAQRLRGLSPGCCDVLGVAALFGREFQLDSLARAIGRPAATVLDLLDEAARLRVAAPVAAAPGRWRFVHFLVAETLADGIGPARRSALHRAAAAALAESATAAEHAAEIAHHYYHAGPGADAGETVRWAGRAADAAFRVFAYEEAARLYRMAVRSLGPASDRTERARLLLRLGEAHKRAGAVDEAKRVFLEVATLARELRSPELLTRAALGFAPTITIAVQPEPDAAVSGLLEEAVASWEGADSPLHACALARLSLGLLFGDEARKADLAARALAMGRRTGDPESLRYVLAAWLRTFDLRVEPETRFAVADDLARLAEAAGDLDALAVVRLWRCVFLLQQGDAAAMRREAAAFLRLVPELRDPVWEWFAEHVRCLGAIVDGRLDDADRHTREAARIGGAILPYAAWGYAVAATLFVRGLQGRGAEAVPEYRTLAAAHPSPSAASPLVWAAAEAEDEAEARRILEPLSADGFAAVRDATGPVCWALLVDACALLRDAPRAAVLYDLLAGHAGRWLPWAEAATLGPADYHLGVLAQTLGRRDDGATHLERAVADSVRAGAPVFAARSQFALARLLRERDAPGDAQRAASLLAEARATAARTGMAGLVRRIDALGAPTAAVADATALFRREGDYWTVAYDGRVIRVRDSRGIGFLVRLLRHPGRQFHATELVRDPAPTSAVPRADPDLVVRPGLGDAGPALDARAQSAYRRRMRELDEEIADAERDGDLGRLERARIEWEALREQLLAEARRPRGGSDAERARLTVTKGIKAALERIAAAHPALGAHLATTVRRGYFCSYTPDPRHPIVWTE